MSIREIKDYLRGIEKKHNIFMCLDIDNTTYLLQKIFSLSSKENTLLFYLNLKFYIIKITMDIKMKKLFLKIYLNVKRNVKRV